MAIPQTFDAAFARVNELVSIFNQNEARYLSTGYSEAQARLDFIDKFWIALGWDVNHEQQTDPYKQEAKVERGVATSEFCKRADYAFLGPNFRDVRFFVEAKKPHAGIDTPLFYFQTIRYGWNRKQLASARTERDKTFYENKCATLDRQIDDLVYELYDLTPEEIAIVEGAGR
jgi:adenine-specific DNA-methyltransferase